MKEKLQALGSNRAGVITFKDGRKGNFGSIRVENENFICYTGQGLREIYPQNGQQTELSKKLKEKTEAELIESGHIAVIPISDIADVQ